MRIAWTPSAAADLEQISDYLFERSHEAATIVVRRIYEAASILKQFPSSGRPGRKEGTRELVVTGLPYLVVYDVDGQTIRVLRILHGARRWP
jgi:toxin ParE1/3/4